MKTFTYTVQDELGIHARPAGMLAKAAAGFKSTITLDNGAKMCIRDRVIRVRRSVTIRQLRHSIWNISARWKKNSG